MRLWKCSNAFSKALQKKNMQDNLVQTFLTDEYKFKNYKSIIHDNTLSRIRNEKFNYCVCFFPHFNKTDLVLNMNL